MWTPASQDTQLSTPNRTVFAHVYRCNSNVKTVGAMVSKSAISKLNNTPETGIIRLSFCYAYILSNQCSKEPLQCFVITSQKDG